MAGQEYLLKTILQLKDNLSAPMREVRKRLNAFGRSIRDLNSASADLASMIGKPFAILAGAGGFSIGQAINSYTELADSIDKASIRAGVSAEALQKLRYVAKNSGMSAEDMDEALTKLTGNMAKAAKGGNANLVAMFQHLGISLRDSNGNIRSAADVMNNLAQAIQANESPAARMEILSAAFGDKLGAKLIPALAGGTEGLKKFGDKAERLGLVMSDKDVAAANEFGDSLGELKDVAGTVSVAVGSKLAPSIGTMIPKLEAVSVRCRDLIATNVQQFVEAFAKELDQIDWEATINGIFATIRQISDFIKAVGGVTTIAKVFGLMIGVNLVLKAAAFVQAVMTMVAAVKALSLALNVNPIVRILTVVAGLAFVLYDNWKPILEWFQDKLDKIGKAMSRLFGRMGNPVSTPNQAGNGALSLPKGFRGVDDSVIAGGGKVESESTINLRIQTDPGTRVRTEGVKSSGSTNLVTEYSFAGAD
mgnify:CR=1 FL=1